MHACICSTLITAGCTKVSSDWLWKINTEIAATWNCSYKKRVNKATRCKLCFFSWEFQFRKAALLIPSESRLQPCCVCVVNLTKPVRQVRQWLCSCVTTEPWGLGGVSAALICPFLQALMYFIAAWELCSPLVFIQSPQVLAVISTELM